MNKNITLLYSFIFLFLVSAGCKDHECPLTKQIVLQGADLKDVSVNSAFPDLNAGTSEKIGASAWTYSSVFGAVRAFINYDLSSIPANAEIVSAQIILHGDTTNAPYGHSQLSGTNEWKVKRVTADWDETAITWNTKPAFDNVNAIAFGPTTSSAQSFSIDITTLVKDQFANPTTYYGIMLQLDTEIEYRLVAFCSREHRYTQLRPSVRITYKAQ